MSDPVLSERDTGVDKTAEVSAGCGSGSGA